VSSGARPARDHGGRSSGNVDGTADTELRQRILWALQCRVCGRALEFRGDLLACGEGHCFAHLQAIETRNGSDLASLRDVETSRPLLLKIPKLAHWNGWSEERLDHLIRHEAATATGLRAALGTGPYRVPDMLPGPVPGRALLMPRLEGPSLERWLYGRDAWLHPRRVLAGCRRSGAWLAAMVTATARGRAMFDPESTLERTREFLAEVADRGHPEHKVRWLATMVEASAARAAGTELLRCLVHGDFRPRHVVLTEEAATVIDWEEAEEDWAHQDAAFYLASLDGFLAQHPRRRWSPAARLAGRAFLAAYLRDAPPGWADVGPLFRVAAMVRALNIDYRGRLARRRPAVFRRVVLPHYDRWFKAWECAERRGYPAFSEHARIGQV
jgi:hypothetical protein